LIHLVSCSKDATKLRLQKLMFLACLSIKKPPYFFFPHKFGPFSFSLDNDLNKLVEKGYIAVSDKSITLGKIAPVPKEPETSMYIESIIDRYDQMSTDSLLSVVYNGYPYYSCRSEVRAKYLKDKNSCSLLYAHQQELTKTIFSIGYEGRTIDSFLDLLIKNRVNLLVDVRASAYSMKPDFIGARLKKYCEAIGVDYRWVPALGIPSKLRKQYANREKLLRMYCEMILPHESCHIAEIETLIGDYNRTAFTCMESKHDECHRSKLTDFIAEKNHYLVEHL
jgi:uncharacterized protein (DUF488 family)